MDGEQMWRATAANKQFRRKVGRSDNTCDSEAISRSLNPNARAFVPTHRQAASTLSASGRQRSGL